MTKQNKQLNSNPKRIDSRKVLRVVTTITLGAVLLFIVLPTAHMSRQSRLVENDVELIDTVYEYGIVFGSSVSPQRKPLSTLEARLDTAAQALLTGKVKKLILSGDNRTNFYNEPTAMKEYLVSSYEINENLLQEDFAGRSTYETCERARKVFSVQRALLFSARTHLPRAIYTCRHFGIEAYGLSSGAEANNALLREPLAVLKMYYNLYIDGEQTVLGEQIDF